MQEICCEIRAFVGFLLLFIFFLHPIIPAYGEENDLFPFSVGVRAAINARNTSKYDVYQYEMFTSKPLPWTWRWDAGWKLRTRAEATFGVIRGKGEASGIVSIGPDLLLDTPEKRFTASTGGGIGLLGDPMLGDIDFGGPVFFRFHAGLMYHPVEYVSIGYRYYHMSNGHIYGSNSSLNLHQAEISFHF